MYLLYTLYKEIDVILHTEKHIFVLKLLMHIMQLQLYFKQYYYRKLKIVFTTKFYC